MQQDLVIDDRLSSPRSELRFSFARSSGPGGQNVNKVNTKAVLHWQATTTPSLPLAIRTRLLEQCRHRVNDQGELVLSSDRYREQGRNVADCLSRLRSLVLAAVRPPKLRRPTRRPRAANEARLKNKKAQSSKKANRRRPAEED